MDISVNYLAVLIAAASTMIVGSVWYAPKVFGNTWMKLAHIDPNKKTPGAEMAMLLGGAFVASLITAFALAYFTSLANKAGDSDFLRNALLVGFLGWIGFTAARIYMHDSFEGRRKKLTLLNASHEFVTTMIMALIIGLMGA